SSSGTSKGCSTVRPKLDLRIHLMQGKNAKREIRVALVGFGLGGASFHGPLIAVTPGMKLATVVTSNEARGLQARRDYPGVHVATTVEWLWEHAADQRPGGDHNSQSHSCQPGHDGTDRRT